MHQDSHQGLFKEFSIFQEEKPKIDIDENHISGLFGLKRKESEKGKEVLNNIDFKLDKDFQEKWNKIIQLSK